MDHAVHHAPRLNNAPALLDDIRAQILAAQKTALPKSATGKAAHYTLALWRRLICFLDHPALELSNNLAENCIQPIAVGRKNWIHIGSAQAGPKIAAILSVIESCRRIKIPVRDYLADVLPGLDQRCIRRLADLTPGAWVSSHKPTAA
jgi:transposase